MCLCYKSKAKGSRQGRGFEEVIVFEYRRQAKARPGHGLAWLFPNPNPHGLNGPCKIEMIPGPVARRTAHISLSGQTGSQAITDFSDPFF